MTILSTLSTKQRLAVAERLVSLQDCKDDHFFAPAMDVPTAKQRPLLEELSKLGYVYWDRVGHRLHPGPEIAPPPEVADIEARREKMLRASPVGRKILGLDTGPSPDTRAGGMSAERRAALLSGSELGRGLLRGEAKAAEAKKA